MSLIKKKKREQNDHFHRDISVSGRGKNTKLGFSTESLNQLGEILVTERTETMNEDHGGCKSTSQVINNYT